MPSNVLKSLADKAGVSMDKAEKEWDAAKASVHKQYPKKSEKDNDFWALVTSITKTRLGIKESFIDLCDNELARIDTLCEAEKFISKAIKHEGALKKHFGLGPDEKIPVEKAQKEYDALKAKADKGKLSSDELQLMQQLGLFLNVLK